MRPLKSNLKGVASIWNSMRLEKERWSKRVVYEVEPSRAEHGVWRVEGLDGEDCFVTNFYGPDSERRAREYCDWVNGRD